MRTNTKALDQFFGIAVRQPSCMNLLVRVRRNGSGYFVLLPHDPDATRLDDGTAWNPHASYHSSGQRHLKSYKDHIFSPDRCQRPDDTFTNSEHLYDCALRPGDWTRSPRVAEPSTYADLFVTDAGALNHRDSYIVSLQLVAPGTISEYTPYGSVLVGRHVFRCAPPWIAASLWHLPTPTATP